jgi:hypothetical protein
MTKYLSGSICRNVGMYDELLEASGALGNFYQSIGEHQRQREDLESVEALAGGCDVAEHIRVLEAVDSEAGDDGFTVSYSIADEGA